MNYKLEPHLFPVNLPEINKTVLTQLGEKDFSGAAESLRQIISFCELTQRKNLSDFWESKFLLARILVFDLGDRAEGQLELEELNAYFTSLPNAEALTPSALEVRIGSLLLLSELQMENADFLKAKSNLLFVREVSVATLGADSLEVATIDLKLKELSLHI